MADIKWDDEQPKAETPLTPSGPKIQFDEPADQKQTNPLAPTVDLKTGLPKNWFQRSLDAIPGGGVIRALGTPASPAMAMPPGASLLGRSVLNAAGGAAEAGTEIASRRLKNAFSQPTLSGLVTGETQQQPSPLDDLKTIGERAGMNALVGGLVGEPLAALGKLVPMTKAANFIRKNDQAMTDAINATQKTAHQTEVAGVRAANAADQSAYRQTTQGIRDAYNDSLRTSKDAYRAMKDAVTRGHGAQVAAQEGKFAADKAAFAEKSANDLTDSFRSQVPAWKDFPSGIQGLQEMVVGKGQAELSKAFDAAMKDVAANAKGKTIEIPTDLAKKLGFSTADSEAAQLQRIFNESAKGKTGGVLSGDQGKLNIRPVAPEGSTSVDAAELANKATGYWKKDTGVYRAVVRALDDAGIGDPGARQAYSAGQALINIIDKSKALKGGTFNPQAVEEAMNSVKLVDELRRRGQGDFFRGPMQSVRGGPLNPTPIPEPVIPPYVTPNRPAMPAPPTPRQMPQAPMERSLPERPEIGSVRNPLAGHGWIGGMLGGGVGATLAHGAGVGPVGHGLGFLAGAGLANALPKELVYRAPISQGAQNAAAVTPGVVATLIRSILGQGQQQP